MFGSTSFCGNTKFKGNELAGTLGALERVGGLTFFKDFTKSGSLDADFALGLRTATYTSTSGSPTTGAANGGYSATVANNDVLKYLIAGNRTAAAETIVIKFTPDSDFANDGVIRFVIDNDTARREIRKELTGTVLTVFPNGYYSRDFVTAILGNTSYVIAVICQASGNPNIRNFLNGVQDGLDENTDFTANAWGTSFYLGVSSYTGSQLNGTIQSIAIFNRALSASEVAAVTNLL